MGLFASSYSMQRVISLKIKYIFSHLVRSRTKTSLTLSVLCNNCYHRRAESVSNAFKDFNDVRRRDNDICTRSFVSAGAGIHQDLQDLFPLQYIYVRTNISFWVEYPEGIQFDVGYIDTKLRKDVLISDRKPVILALPSSVGNHLEMTGILLTFAKLGYRVVIPNLPGSQYCRGKRKEDEAVCQHSVQEKADFVRDFLKEIGVTKVDMLVTNSCSVYTGVSLCVSHTSLFKSFVMINPTGLQPTQSMLPLWIHKKFTSVYDDRYVLQGLLNTLVAGTKKLTKKKHWPTINVVTYSRFIAALSFKDEKMCGNYLKTRSISRYAIFGEDSETLDVKSTLEYLEILDIPKSAITELDEDCKIVKQGTPFEGNYGLHMKGTSSEDITHTGTAFLRKELLKILQSVCPDL